jgi:putative ABC transport system permease protein
MITDYFNFALAAIMHRGTRSFLTMLGIVVGIATIVVLIAVGQGMQDSITSQFEKIGSNRIMIVPGGVFMGPVSGGLSSSKLTESDLSVVQRVRGVEISRGIIAKPAEAKFGDKTKPITVMGTPTDSESSRFMESIGFLDVEKGRQLTDSDTYGVIIGNKFGSSLFNKTITTGDKIDINGKTFRVIGIQASMGMGTYDIMARIGVNTAKDLFNVTDEFTGIYGSVAEGYTVSDVAERVKEALRKHRGEKVGEETFSVQTTEQMVSSLGSIIGIVQTVFVGLAAISLIVGGVGIMNSMYTSVLERTRQIGIMKSVGARNSDILWIFMFESGIIGLIGGAFGILAGVGLSLAFNFIATSMLDLTFQAAVTIPLVAGALAFSFLVGMISGFMPAQRAARMRPADAMR